MQNPAPFDPYSKNYNEIHNEHLLPGLTHEQFFQQKLNWVSDLIGNRSGIALLDFGCNQGELGRALRTRFPEIVLYGVDESKASIETAKELAEGLSSPLFFHPNIQEIEPVIHFDIITLFNVLHHIPPNERIGILSDLRNRLKPGGQLLIWEHNPWNPITRYLIKICPFDKGVTLVASGWIKSILRDLGFQDIDFQYVNIIPPKLHRFKFIAWLEKFFSFAPIGAQYKIKTLHSRALGEK